MIRLVNQFDDSDRQVSVATPTCGGCCCCCCCLISFIGSSGFTALNLRNISARNMSKSQGSDRERIIALGGVSLLLALVIYAVGVLVLSNLFQDFSGIGDLFAIQPLIIGIIWGLFLYHAYKKAGLDRNGSIAISLVTVVLSAMTIGAEFFLVISGYLDGIGLEGYVVGLIVIVAALMLFSVNTKPTSRK